MTRHRKYEHAECSEHGMVHSQWIEGAWRCEECGEPCEIAPAPPGARPNKPEVAK